MTDKIRLHNAAFKGDLQAAVLMVYEAVRQNDWNLIALLGQVMSEGKKLEDSLSVGQRLRLGQKDFPEDLTLHEIEWDLLPERLTVRGDLKVWRPAISKPPFEIAVGGSVHIEGGFIENFKNSSLWVGGRFLLKNTEITTLPDNLTVGGDLDIKGCPHLFHLPANIKVRGSLFLSGSEIKSLPANLKVSGDLNIQATNISELPENLVVEGRLLVAGSAVTKLPENLKVGEDLDIQATNISELPDSLEVGGKICLFGSEVSPSFNAEGKNYTVVRNLWVY